MEIKAAIWRYCQYRERCHAEVRNKLYELGCTTPEVEQQLTELIEIGMLNEERYARAYARGKFRMLQWGRVKIVQQLKVHKISEYCIRKALTEIDADEYERVLNKLADKKMTELKHVKQKLARKSRLYKYLVQKGYEQSMITDIINERIKS